MKIKKIGSQFLIRNDKNRVVGVHVTKKAAEKALLKLIGAAGKVVMKEAGKAISKTVKKGKKKKSPKK